MLMRLPIISALSLSICFISLFSLGTASAQIAPIRKPPFTQPLEKYDMPPAPPRKMETSPRMISQFGVFTSYQANVDANGNNILGDCANEPSISVDPTNGNRMMIGWRQFNSISSDPDLHGAVAGRSRARGRQGVVYSRHDKWHWSRVLIPILDGLLRLRHWRVRPLHRQRGNMADSN